MRRNASLALFAALFLSIIIAPALADKRVALVIGNGALSGGASSAQSAQ